MLSQERNTALIAPSNCWLTSWGNSFFVLSLTTFLKSPIGKLIKKNEHQKFIIQFMKFAKTDPFGFTYIESHISSRVGYKREILSHLIKFVKENKHNVSRK